MTVADLIERVQRERPGLVTTLEPPDEALIGAAEERLSLTFPERYREFVSEVGAKLRGAWEGTDLSADRQRMAR